MALFFVFLFFFKNANFLKVNLPTDACPGKNCKHILILPLLNYSECKDLLHMLNIYNIPATEHKAVDPRTAEELPVLTTTE